MLPYRICICIVSEQASSKVKMLLCEGMKLILMLICMIRSKGYKDKYFCHFGWWHSCKEKDGFSTLES